MLNPKKIYMCNINYLDKTYQYSLQYINEHFSILLARNVADTAMTHKIKDSTESHLLNIEIVMLTR